MRKLVLTLIVLFSIKSFAQKNPEKEIGFWYMYNGSHTLSDKFSLKSMAHFRFFNLGGDLQQFIGRIGGNYKINNNLSATLGYAYISTDNTFDLNDSNITEYRIYEDFNAKHKVSALGFAHRLRAEQRFFDTKTRYFIRYQLNISYPISNKWTTYIYDEVFFDFNQEAYNQNWIGLGFFYKTSNKIKLKFGYQNISINNGFNLNRILLGLVLTTDHRKKK